MFRSTFSHQLNLFLLQKPSAKSFSPPKSILTQPQPSSTTIAPAPTLLHSSSLLSPSAPPFTPISSTQDEINDFKNSRVVIKVNWTSLLAISNNSLASLVVLPWSKLMIQLLLFNFLFEILSP
ncbi:hypothetical protein RhiirA5_437756 [Rhizophagus irregularis]|uniref:Uncharacterized protein n=1 Tax=Rhizophagus irregularis TaxID=588596 RepID=A0A2N0NK30_9GLOM|nr:hypothetical protein RhiirA5_437756 [Rhizophagus irregularis]